MAHKLSTLPPGPEELNKIDCEKPAANPGIIVGVATVIVSFDNCGGVLLTRINQARETATKQCYVSWALFAPETMGLEQCCGI